MGRGKTQEMLSMCTVITHLKPGNSSQDGKPIDPVNPLSSEPRPGVHLLLFPKFPTLTEDHNSLLSLYIITSFNPGSSSIHKTLNIALH